MKNVKAGHEKPVVCLDAGHYGKYNRSPVVPEGYACRLTDALEWEVYPLPDEGEPDPDLTDGEILDILLGGAV